MIPTIVVGEGNQRKVVDPVLLTGIGPEGDLVAIRASDTGVLQIEGAGSGSTVPFNAGNVSGNVTFVFANGANQKAALTDAVVVQVPTGGTEGANLELRLTASGANRNLSFHGNIEIPSDSAVSFPKALTSGKTYIAKLRLGTTKWALVTLVGGFTD